MRNCRARVEHRVPVVAFSYEAFTDTFAGASATVREQEIMI
jgi:hypothetical protein